MPKMFTSDGVVIAKVMRELLNRWPEKPCEIMLESIDKKAPSMMLQQLASAEKIKQYVDGSYIGAWNFAVYIRVGGRHNASRYDAFAALDKLGTWLTARDSSGSFTHLPEIDSTRIATSIEMSSTPSIASMNEDGTEDYQAIFSLEYKFKRRT